MSSYSEIEYPREESGTDDYPQRLVDYLIHRFFRKQGRLLDIGCGKGDYVKAFRRRLFFAEGVDVETPLYQCNLEKDSLPFFKNTFDYIFSKSTLEHIWDWKHLLTEARMVLKQDGLAVFIVPDWDSQKYKFYNDVTHLKPYTRDSLAMAFKLAGFSHVHCEYFNLHKFKKWNKLPAWILYFREKTLLCWGYK